MRGSETHGHLLFPLLRHDRRLTSSYSCRSASSSPHARTAAPPRPSPRSLGMSRMMRHETLVLVIRHERLLARSTRVQFGLLLSLVFLFGEELFLMLLVQELRLCLVALVAEGGAFGGEVKVQLRRGLEVGSSATVGQATRERLRAKLREEQILGANRLDSPRGNRPCIRSPSVPTTTQQSSR